MTRNGFRSRCGRVIKRFFYVTTGVGDLFHVEKLFLFGNKQMVEALDLNDPAHRIVNFEANQLMVVSEGSYSFLGDAAFMRI
jgi:hypothetical protein